MRHDVIKSQRIGVGGVGVSVTDDDGASSVSDVSDCASSARLHTSLKKHLSASASMSVRHVTDRHPHANVDV
jgi:hypothetical protein